jgi:DMSO/TMAO reductase YedYZ molybdopterin-dependent catalytic subunit
MNESILLKIDGEVGHPLRLTYADLEAFDPKYQIRDVRRIDSRRKGDAVTLAGILEVAGARPKARYLGLHSSSDDFHASIPLDAVRDRAFVIYRLEGKSLDVQSGGPLRFFIPDHAACHTDEIDECANVKFVDHIELTVARGIDNRPHDEQEHEKLHRQES